MKQREKRLMISRRHEYYRKLSVRHGLPTQSWSRKATEVGECALTLRTSTKPAPKTAILCHKLIRRWNHSSGFDYWMPIKEEDMLLDIQETFDWLLSINMKLNPKKCSFGVEEGPFLGHLITKQRIKANPSKVKAITDLKPPKTLKEI
ncbi:hypothetical protein Tco_1392229 [Tanacetum coccineum]